MSVGIEREEIKGQGDSDILDSVTREQALETSDPVTDIYCNEPDYLCKDRYSSELFIGGRSYSVPPLFPRSPDNEQSPEIPEDSRGENASAWLGSLRPLDHVIR